jgi:hypothetical protein
MVLLTSAYASVQVKCSRNSASREMLQDYFGLVVFMLVDISKISMFHTQ